MGIFGGNPVHKPAPTPETPKAPVSTPRVEKKLPAANEHAFRPTGFMNTHEFEHHFTNRLHQNTSLTRDEIKRAHAIGEGFMDSDRSGFFTKEGMDSHEGQKYLRALRDGGFSDHQIDQVREAMLKDFE